MDNDLIAIMLLNNSIIEDLRYYPFGMLMPERSFSSEDYRYGFNTQESVDEIAGIKNHYTAMYWEYDPRTLRRWNLDPKPVPWESGYAANKNNPIWINDPLGDFGKNGEERRRERAQEKFDKKVTKPLMEMAAQGATPDQVQTEADRLADKYQNTRWLHYSYGVANPNNVANESYKSTATGFVHQQKIGIKAYQTTTTNAQVDNNRPADGSMVNTGTTGQNAAPGSTVNVQFNPLAQPNSLTVTTVDPSGGTSTIANTGGMISDPSNTLGVYMFNTTTAITTVNAGQIQYTVQNTNANAAMDNWQLRIQVTSPPLLNPIPIVTSNYPFP